MSFKESETKKFDQYEIIINNEKKIIKFIIKFIYYKTYLLGKLFWYSIKSLPFAFVVTILFEFKVLPIVLHYYFIQKY